MKSLLTLLTGFVLGIATMFLLQQSPNLIEEPREKHQQKPAPAAALSSSSTAQSAATPASEGKPTEIQDTAAGAKQTVSALPEIDAPHPVFGYYRGKPGNFSEWNDKLKQEQPDFYWQSRMQLAIQQEMAADPVLNELELKEVNCRQSACRVSLGFSAKQDSDMIESERHLQVVHALLDQNWSSHAAGTGTHCQLPPACEATIYLPRDPSNDPEMDRIPWRRGG